MSTHYDIYLIHSVGLPGGTDYVDAHTDDYRATKLHFELGAGGWHLQSSADAMVFETSDTSILVPNTNVALMEVWED